MQRVSPRSLIDRFDYPVVRGSERGLIAVIGGTSMDMFVKREGIWQFSRKRLVLDIAGDWRRSTRIDFPSGPAHVSVRNHANANS